MVAQRLQIEYWSGSVWTPFVDGSTSLLLSLHIDEHIYEPAVARFKVADIQDNGPFASSSTESVLKEFMDIRIVNPDNHIIQFYGKIYRMTHGYEAPYGAILEVVAYDIVYNLNEEYLEEVADSIASTKTSTMISTWISNHISSTQLSLANDLGDVDRFETSGINRSDTSNPVKAGRSQTSLLTAILREALQDKRLTAEDHGYIFYSDPNFTSTATSHHPAQFFTYYARNRMPALEAGAGGDAAPATNGLTFEKPDGATIDNTGTKHIMMSQLEVSRSGRELLTDVIANYIHDTTGEQVSKRFSILHYTAVSSVTSAQYDGISFDALVGSGADQISKLVDKDDNLIAYIQYMTQASGAGFVLISDRSSHALEAGEKIYIDSFAGGTYLTLTTNTALGDQAVYEPKAVWGVTKTAKVWMTSEVSPDGLRTRIAAMFEGAENVPTRLGFSTWELPYYWEEGQATTSTTGATLHDSAVDWEAKGLRTGAALIKLDGSGGDEAAWGYVSGLTDGGVITSTLNTGSWSVSDYYKWQVRLRAGHQVRIVCLPQGISGENQLVTRITIDQNLSSQTSIKYETQGTYAPSKPHAELGLPEYSSDAVSGNNTIPLGKIAAKFAPNVTPAFKAGDAYLGPSINTMHQYISWGAGTLRLDGQINIDGVEKTEYSITTGNSGPLNPDYEYVMYFEPASSETQFQIQRSSTYTSKDRTRAKVGTVQPVIASVGAATGEGNESEILWDMNDGTLTMEGGNSQKLGGDYIAVDGLHAKHVLVAGSDATTGIRFKFNTPSGDTSGANTWFRGFSSNSNTDTSGKWFEFDVANERLNFYDGAATAKLLSRISGVGLVFYSGQQATADATDVLAEMTATGLTFYNNAGSGASNKTVSLIGNNSTPANNGLYIYGISASSFGVSDQSLITYESVGGIVYAHMGMYVSSSSNYLTLSAKGATGIYLYSNDDPGSPGGMIVLAPSVGAGVQQVGVTSGGVAKGQTFIMPHTTYSTPYVEPINQIWIWPSAAPSAGQYLEADVVVGGLTSTLKWSDPTLHSTALSSGSVPTSSYGTFRYDTDGNGGAADVLAFASGQQSATPAAATGESTFWTMLSENDGASGSRLIFEPIVDAGFTAGADNYAYIGWHNPIFATYSYYFNASYDSAAFPSFTFWGDNDTGMYHPATNTLGLSAGGVLRLSLNSSGTTLSTLTVAGGTSIVHNGGLLTAASSSRRYKENILDLSVDTVDIYKLRPVTFDWKSNKQPDFGLIAEEVDEILPMLVHYDNAVPESVAYEKLSVLLLMEVRKLREEVNNLKETN